MARARTHRHLYRAGACFFLPLILLETHHPSPRLVFTPHRSSILQSCLHKLPCLECVSLPSAWSAELANLRLLEPQPPPWAVFPTPGQG
ncbi:hypothetical protein EI94DRAFT_1748189 [Lactarius quietus]|nr:hypothetical protein EI94DRAFT_1748189 [Lactarius quietus]